MKKILIAMPVFAQRCPDALALLENHDVIAVCQNAPGPINLDAYASLLPKVEGIITGTESVWGAPEMDRIKQLRIIARFGVGYDNVDVAAAAARGIVCTNAPDGNRNSVAEYTLALLLTLLRGIPQNSGILRRGGWEKIQGLELAGKTVGLLGYGAIAKRVAELLVPFGVRLLASDPFPSPGTVPVEMVNMEELLRQSDVLSIHVAATPQTRSLIGSRELALMKPAAVLVNLSRGGVVDEAALYDALRGGYLRGAAADVFAAEPPPTDHPLLTLDNFIGTCHLAGGSVEASTKIGMTVAWAVLDALAGQQPKNIIAPLEPV